MIKNIHKLIIQHYVISIIVIFILSMNFLYITFRNVYAVGRIDNVERIIDEEDKYKRKNIELVMDIVEKKFNTKDYRGYVLKNITYIHDYKFANFAIGKEPTWKSREEYLKEKYNGENAIMLEIEYKSNIFSIMGKNEFLTADITFILNNGEWKIVSWGQG